MDVFDGDDKVGELTLSQRQLQILEKGQPVVVRFHTPQLLQHLLGDNSGSFELGKNSAGRIVVRAEHAAALKRFLDLQADVKAARER